MLLAKMEEQQLFLEERVEQLLQLVVMEEGQDLAQGLT